MRGADPALESHDEPHGWPVCTSWQPEERRTTPGEGVGRVGRRQGGNGAARPHDPALTDEILRSEIELLAEIIAVAGASEGRLSQEQIDEALGVHGQEGGEAAP